MPTTVYANARIYTLHPDAPRAGAMAVEDGRITWIGDTEDVGAGLADTTIDLGGAVVLPGLTDAHTHFLAHGLQMQRVDLRDTESEAEAVQRVVQYAQKHPKTVWIEGFGWNDHRWGSPGLPSRESLDRALGSRPVALSRIDGHVLWVNSMALQIAGITEETPDPPGGELDRDDDGRLTGILRETARDLLFEAIEPPSVAERVDAIRAAQVQAHALGLTGIHTIEDDDALEAFQALRDDGALRIRTLFMPPINSLKSLRMLDLSPGHGDEWLRLGQLKIFADGSLGSRTAWMIEPYEHEPANTGIPTHTRDELHRLIHNAHESGWPVAVHAIGDAAARAVLDALATAPQADGIMPDRIEHAQLLHPRDLPRLAEHGIVASMQPIHMASDWKIATRFWGDRARWGYAWRSLAEQGTILAFGSDVPIEPMNPWPNLQVTVTRRDLDGEPAAGWYPQEALSVEQAIAGFTRGAAYAAGDARQGQLAAGAYADFILLDRDPFDIPPSQLNELRPIATIVGGQIIHGNIL